MYFTSLFNLTTCRLTSHIRPHRRAPPCAASQWGPGQGRPASHLPPRSPFRHSLLHWFYARHLRGISIIHQPVSSQCSSCSEAVVVEETWWEGCGDGKSCRMNVGLGVGGWSGRVRRAHSRPYPLSCFMATVLNGVWTSITASCQSEPSDSGRCWLEKLCQESACAVLSRESLLLLIFYHLSSAAQDIIPQSDT